jgi:hypothetical protein
MKMKVVTAIAIISTAIAVVEAVILVQAARREAPATQAVASGNPESPHPTVAPPASGTEDSPEKIATATSSNGATPAGTTRSGETSSAENGAAATTPVNGAEEVELTPEEKQAREDAEAMAKVKEGMMAMADKQVRDQIARLKLDDFQQEQAAESIESYRQSVLGMMAMMDMGKDSERRIKEIREEAQLRGLSEAEIGELVQAEQMAMMDLVRSKVIDGMTGMSAALEEIRPLLNALQTPTLDQMQKEIKDGKETTIRMMDAARPRPKTQPAP